MKTVHATFEAGVFKPAGFVPLPEHCEVEFEPRVVLRGQPSKSVAAIYAVLGERYRSGETDVAARHDEHQP